MANTATTQNTVRGKEISSVLRYMNESLSKSDCVFTSGQTAKHPIGQIMKLDGATGRLIPVAAAADTPVGIVLYEVNATGASHVEGWYLARQAELASAGLEYWTGATQGDKDTMNSKLTALGLVVRTSV